MFFFPPGNPPQFLPIELAADAEAPIAPPGVAAAIPPLWSRLPMLTPDCSVPGGSGPA